MLLPLAPLPPPLEDSAVRFLPVPACSLLPQPKSRLPGSTVVLPQRGCQREWAWSLVQWWLSVRQLWVMLSEPHRARQPPRSDGPSWASLRPRRICWMTAACPARMICFPTRTRSRAAACGWTTLCPTLAWAVAVRTTTILKCPENLERELLASGRGRNPRPGRKPAWTCSMQTALKRRTLFFHNWVQTPKSHPKWGWFLILRLKIIQYKFRRRCRRGVSRIFSFILPVAPWKFQTIRKGGFFPFSTRRRAKGRSWRLWFSQRRSIEHDTSQREVEDPSKTVPSKDSLQSK